MSSQPDKLIGHSLESIIRLKLFYDWDGTRGNKGSGNKLYTVKCHTCAKDRELFGEALYKAPKDSILRGSASCGCSPKES